MGKGKNKKVLPYDIAYGLGILNYKNNNFQAAVECFSMVLNPLLSKTTLSNRSEIGKQTVDDLKDQLLGSMYYLGKIEEASGRYVEAAAIFQYCAKFSEKYNTTGGFRQYIEYAYEVENNFLESVNGNLALNTQSKHQVEENKIALIKFRTSIKQRIKELDEYDIEDLSTRTILVEDIYEECTNFYVNRNPKEGGLIQKLIRYSIDQLGSPPDGCEYTVIGLGSISGGKMTPYSDIEFAILINKDDETYKQYFRNLTKLLNIKVINFGETALRMVGIETLNNFKTQQESDDWFWDDITSNGFSFDGPHWHACKTPLGRKGVNNKDDFELIRTPEKMLEFQIENLQISHARNWFESDVYLVHSLRHVLLIEGSQKLLDQYREGLKKIDHEIIRPRVLKILKGDIEEYGLKAQVKEGGKIYNVKQNLYRLIDKMIDLLADYYQIVPEPGEAGLTAWQKIDTMKYKGVLNVYGAESLREAVSIATELRLRTYGHNSCQIENLSIFEKNPANTFCFKNIDILQHFYYIMLSTQKAVGDFCTKINIGQDERMDLSTKDLFDDNEAIKAMVFARFLKYGSALKSIEDDRGNSLNNEDFVQELYDLYYILRDGSNCLKIADNLFQLKTISSREDPYIIIDYLHKQGLAKFLTGEFKAAKKDFKSEHNIFVRLNVTDDKYDLSKLIDNWLGLVKSYGVLIDRSIKNNLPYEHKKCYQLETYLAKLEMVNKLGVMDKPTLAKYYDYLGAIKFYIYHKEESAKYYTQKALQIKLRLYNKIPNHPDIAVSYSSLAKIELSKNSYIKAEFYMNKALSIQGVIFKELKTSIDINNSYDNLGRINLLQGNYNKAIEYFEKIREGLEFSEINNKHVLEQLINNYKFLHAAYKMGGVYSNPNTESSMAGYKDKIDTAVKLKGYQPIHIIDDITEKEPLAVVNEVICDYLGASSLCGSYESHMLFLY